jgi:PREDICTED: similar to testis-specific protein pbs13 (t-complex 11 )
MLFNCLSNSESDHLIINPCLPFNYFFCMFYFIFRGIMELLDLMKLDMANFLVKKYRPHILQKSVSYEKEKFIQFLELQTSMILA